MSSSPTVLVAALYSLLAAIEMRPVVGLDIWWHLHQAAWDHRHHNPPFAITVRCTDCFRDTLVILCVATGLTALALGRDVPGHHPTPAVAVQCAFFILELTVILAFEPVRAAYPVRLRSFRTMVHRDRIRRDPRDDTQALCVEAPAIRETTAATSKAVAVTSTADLAASPA